MSETVACAIEVDGTVRATCCGCSAILEEAGLIKPVLSKPINERQPEFRFVLYVLIKPNTLADCQAKIAHRHIGLPWGELP
jgi:hypothetical protein